MFYVGQRVRIRWSFHHPEYVGREGLIVEIGDYFDRSAFDRGRFEEFVGHVMDFNHDFAPMADQLEPILPPGLESIEEINALYAPDPVEARA